MDVLTFPDAPEWETWLERWHDTADEAWLRIAKRRSGIVSLTTEEAVEVALCFGWIDAVRRAFDEVSFLQRYCPRRPRSAWSQINVERAVALIEAGRMRPPGLRQVEAAQADGRWAAAYPRQRDAQVPEDLAAALAGDEVARAALAALNKSARFAVLLPIFQAVTTEARERAVAGVVRRLRSAPT